MQQSRKNLVKGASSRYDYVKVRVWLESKYYYVLSRFSVSQILMLCRVPQREAQKIALRLKKHLIDRGILDIEQENLNQSLFQLAQSFGISETVFQLYTKVLHFYQLKLPVIIVLYGVHQVNMTEIAGKLAERLNIYNVLDTDTVYHIWRLMTSQESSLSSSSCIVGQLEKPELQEYSSWFKALEGNLSKFFRDGKALIMYGLFLEPVPIASILERNAWKGRKRCYLEYMIESELLGEELSLFMDNRTEHSHFQLYGELHNIQQEYKKQAERNGIPCLYMESTKDSIMQVIESVHEDYLRLIVSLSEKEETQE